MAHFLLLNLDNGDVVELGKQRHFTEIEELGLPNEHRFFDAIPHYDSFSNPAPGQPDFRAMYQRAGHALNVFLAHARGCRLVVMDEDELQKIIHEIEDDDKLSYGGIGGAMHIGNPTVGKPYFSRRLAHIKTRKLFTDNERRARAEKQKRYRDEIKSVLRKNFVQVTENERGYMKYQAGNQDPDPIADVWDDNVSY
jgi:hypothetical protein